MPAMSELNYIQWFLVVTLTVICSTLFCSLIVVRAGRLLIRVKVEYQQSMVKLILDGFASGLIAMGDAMVRRAAETKDDKETEE